MKIEIAKHGRMSESGNSLLRLIQNQEMPLLDLFVRESVQNSLDASDGHHQFVNVDISVKPFKSKELNKHFDGIDSQLNSKFPNNSSPYQSIVIKDSNTVGLTGPVNYDQVDSQNFGNLLKLVYEISKPQTNEGAGGSWGLGKTIYFRIGIGLVIYYSRIKTIQGYESRLAACFVEDETKMNTVLPSESGVKRGIAWWGEYKSRNSKETIPITNEKEISQILSVFSIIPYEHLETGTTVIIPYIDSKKLLKEVYPINEEKENKPYWTSKVEDYLSVTFQRWYAPRILNTKYNHGAYLKPSIQNKGIRLAEFEPLFKVIRELYIYAVTGTEPEDSFIEENGGKINAEEIRIRDVFVNSSIAGKFVFLKMNQKQLLMDPPENNKSPYQQITNRLIPMENGNTPIIMYTRKPGMIVGYDFTGAWTHGMPKSSDIDYIIGLFVVNSENVLRDVVNPKDSELLLMEEYIRLSEKADHASWSDWNISGTSPRAVSKIQKGIIKTISQKYKERPVDNTERTNLGLSRALANILLPPTDFGHAPYVKPAPCPSITPRTKKRVNVSEISAPEFADGKIYIHFQANVHCGLSIMQLAVVTDFKKYEADDWENEDEIGNPFPLQFCSFEILEIKDTDKKSQWHKHKLKLSDCPVSDGIFELSFRPSEVFGVMSIVEIFCNKPYSIKGTTVFYSDDPSIKGSISIYEVKNSGIV